MLRRLREKEFDETRREIVVVVSADSDESGLEGRVLSSNLQVNFLRRFGYLDNLMVRALPGPLLTEPYVKMRVRAPADPISGICPEMECFVRKRMWERAKLRNGCSVSVIATRMRLRNATSIWIADHFERLGESQQIESRYMSVRLPTARSTLPESSALPLAKQLSARSAIKPSRARGRFQVVRLNFDGKRSM